MSSTEKIDSTIEKLIDALVEEYGQTGFLSTPSPERKSQIIDEIAKLRYSMNPQSDPRK